MYVTRLIDFWTPYHKDQVRRVEAKGRSDHIPLIQGAGGSGKHSVFNQGTGSRKYILLSQLRGAGSGMLEKGIIR